jgi:hypothetical protein
LFPAMGYLVSCRMQNLTNVVMGFPCIYVNVFIFHSPHWKRGVPNVITVKLSSNYLWHQETSYYWHQNTDGN